MGDGKLKSKQGHSGKHIKPTEDKIGTAFSLDHPVFCFRYLNKDYHIDKCQPEEKLNLIERLVVLGGMTWNEIRLSHKHSYGSEKIELSSIKSGKPTVPVTGDQLLLAFRFHGKAPFVGVRNKFVFHIVYIDRDFTLYDHG